MRPLSLLCLALTIACAPASDTSTKPPCDDPEVSDTADTGWLDTGEAGDTSVDTAPELRLWCTDTDGDLHGTTVLAFCQYSEHAPSPAHQPNSTDCDDTDASIYPGATDAHGDGVDSDCDGQD